MNKFCSLDKH
jgi:hypothetical protein